MAPCLTEQGIPVRALPDGGIAFGEIRAVQAPLQREAMYRCMVRFPTHPLFAEPSEVAELQRTRWKRGARGAAVSCALWLTLTWLPNER